MNNLAVINNDNTPFVFIPKTFEAAMEYAKVISKTNLVPTDYHDKPEAIFVAMQWGAELGLKPLQAVQNIAVINGRPSIWGDALLAIVQQHSDYEWHKEWSENKGTQQEKAHFQIKRKGSEVHETSYGLDDAKKAGLFDKKGTWQTNPSRMLQMRARGFGLRDKFADAIKGFITREEAEDYPAEKNITAQSEVLNLKINKIVEKAKQSAEEPKIKEPEKTPETQDINQVMELINTAASIDELKKTKGYIKSMVNITDEQKANLVTAYNLKCNNFKDCKEAKEFFGENTRV